MSSRRVAFAQRMKMNIFTLICRYFCHVNTWHDRSNLLSFSGVKVRSHCNGSSFSQKHLKILKCRHTHALSVNEHPFRLPQLQWKFKCNKQRMRSFPDCLRGKIMSLKLCYILLDITGTLVSLVLSTGRPEVRAPQQSRCLLADTSFKAGLTGKTVSPLTKATHEIWATKK